MKKKTGLAGGAVCAVVMLLAALPLRAQTESTIPGGHNSTQLVGTWKLVSGKYNGQSFDFGKQVILKHVTGGQFMWLRYDADTKKISQSAGGPYTVHGDTYVEHPVYGIGESFEVIKDQDQTFHWKVAGNKWSIDGQLANGVKIGEVWELVKPETAMAAR
jgi:hypothetical protein